MLKGKIGIWSFLLIFISGCASTGFLMAKPEVTMFGNAYSPKSEEAKIDVYITSLPTTEYVEFAQISCADSEDTWNMEQILKEARKIGADGIIVTGKTGAFAVGGATYAASRQYGITAIAIKYKNE
jgi:hypothetical protein